MPFKYNPITNELNVVDTTGGMPAVATITGNDSVPVPASAGNNINVVGSGNLTTSGNAGTNTETIALTGITQHAVQVGSGTNTLTQVTPSTTGFVFASNGASADPSFQSVSPLGGSLVLIQSITTASSTTINFMTGTNLYRDYYLIWELKCNTSGDNLQMLVSNDGGSTWKVTNYASGLNINPRNSVLTTNVNASTAINLTGPFSSSNNGSGSVSLYRCNTTSMFQVLINSTYFDSTQGAMSFAYGSSLQSTFTGINAFQLITSSGSGFADGGKATLYGFAQS